MSGSKRTSWLYMRGDRRLRESAGTSCGSRPVASGVWAGVKPPPGLGGGRGSLCVGVLAQGQGAQGEAAHLEEPAPAETRVVGALAIRRHVMPPRGGYCELGSRMSRKPSPSRLKASTVIMMAMPGKTEIQGAVSR